MSDDDRVVDMVRFRSARFRKEGSLGRRSDLFSEREKDLFERRLRDRVGFNIELTLVLLQQLKEFSRRGVLDLK